MIIPKKNKIMVYSYLFKEGCIVAEKDFYKAKHEQLDVPNIHVMQLMKSLVSRDLVRETFNWQYHYWFLKDEGVEYLRKYLHLPEAQVPMTHQRKTSAPARVGPTPGEKPMGGRPFGDRPERGLGRGEFRGGGFGASQGGFGRGAGPV